jgi:ribosomal protein S14
VEEQLQSLTRHSTLGFITNRCSLTSKAGGCLHRWRLSRIVWRSLADYNQMSGVQRSTWGTPSRNAAMFTFRKQKKSWFNYDGFRQIAYTDTTGARQKQRFKI